MIVDIDQVITFPRDAGLPHRATRTSVLVPCDLALTCVTARDQLHTLRSRAPDFADAGDFTYMAINFLKFHEPNCCGASNARETLDDSANGPVISISVSDLWRRGMGELAAADLNGDGMLDEADMATFARNAGLDFSGSHREATLKRMAPTQAKRTTR